MSSIDGRLDAVIFWAAFTTLCRFLPATAKPDCDVVSQDALHYTSVEVNHDDITHA